MKKINYSKVDYSTIQKGKSMPIAYIDNNQVKTIFRTIRQDEKGFYVTINAKKQYVSKSEKKFKGVSTIVVSGGNAISKKSVKKVEKAKAEKVASKREKKQNKRINNNKQVEVIPNIEFIPIALPFFTKEENETINRLINEKLNGYSYIRNEKTIKINGWNDLQGEHKQEKVYLFETIQNNLINAQSIQDVQTPIILLLGDNIKNMIRKMLEFGANVKKRDKEKSFEELQQLHSYQKASSNNGKITAYDIDDIYNELIIHSYEKLFDEKMFIEYQNIFQSLYFRVSNILRKEIRRHAKFKANIGHDDMMAIIENKQVFDKPFSDIVEIASTICNFTENEKKLLKMRLMGYDKKEIDTLTNKRNDRTFQSYEKKLAEKSGMTLKEAKQLNKHEKEVLKQKRQELRLLKKGKAM